MNNNIHYFRTKVYYNEMEAWTELSSYLDKEMRNKIVFVREPPMVYGDKDFDEKEWKYQGFVRFQVISEPEDRTDRIPSIGDS